MTDLAVPSRADALDVFVRLLSELDAEPAEGAQQFYDRLCEAVCNLTSMRRAGLLLYDETRKLVVPVGSHGLPPDLLRQIYGNLEETPIARRALAEDCVVVASDEELERGLPARYARFPGVTTLTCTPVAAGERWLGVIFADRGGGRFELTGPEGHALWTLGKTAALAASARIATTEEERSRVLAERVDLARHIHERVIQRLFGVSLVVGSGRELSAGERRRCADEIQAALVDLRATLVQPRVPGLAATDATLRGELDRLGRHYKALALDVAWELDEPLPAALEPLAQAVLAEALRNADRHAAPSSVRVRVARTDGAFTLEVRNDGLRERRGEPARTAGMGLRLAAFDALQRGGVVEFGPDGDQWRVRLVLPLS